MKKPKLPFPCRTKKTLRSKGTNMILIKEVGADSYLAEVISARDNRSYITTVNIFGIEGFDK